MAKSGSAKNTKNKAKHTKLMNRKKNKARTVNDLHKEKIAAIQKKYNAQLREQEGENT